MPKIGEIKSDGIRNRQWVICPDCQLGRWVILSAIKRSGFSGRCHDCNTRVRGGNRIKANYRWINSNGYVMVKLQPGDFFFPMTGKDGYVLEHRLATAKAIGRCLHSWEIVHHKGTLYAKGTNEDKADNRYPENLQLVSDDRHKQITVLESKIKRLEATNARLRTKLERQTI